MALPSKKCNSGKMRKKALAGVLTTALVVGNLTLPESISLGKFDFGAMFAQAAEIVDSGTCGDNLTWVLDDEGTLTISGTGEMDNHRLSNPSPWYDYRSDIKTVVIEDGVTNIGDYEFSGYASLTSIDIPDSVTSIGDRAFYYCTNLTNVDIPDSVTSIGEGLFSECEGLTTIKISESVTNIKNDTFFDCTSLTNIYIPDSVISIGDTVFGNCTSLTNIDMSESITDIGNSAFYNCTSLTSIDMPDCCGQAFL